MASLPLELQLNLFRELHFRDYEASTGHSPSPGDARLVMSTSENLPALIEQGRFRQELYHRISVISLMLPPLRHRGTDIELLAESFRGQYAREFHKSVAGFTRDALDVLQKHDWPGNVRELEAAVQRAVALCNGPRITSSNLSPILNHNRQSRAVAGGTPRPHLQDGGPTTQRSPRRARKADHHPGARSVQLEPPGDSAACSTSIGPHFTKK